MGNSRLALLLVRAASCLVLTAAPVAAQVVAGPPQGERRGWFGISLSCEDCFVLRGPDRVAYVRSPAVASVETGSPAAQAGLRRGDSLIAAEGMPLTTAEGFQRYAEARPGAPIRLTVRHAGQQREVTVVPAERANASTIRDFYVSRLRIAQRRGPDALRAGFRMPMGWLGMSVECERCDDSDFGSSRAWQFRSPAAVVMVDVDGPAHGAGLRRGDTVTAIGAHELASAEGGRAFSSIEPGQRVTLTVRRGGTERRVSLAAVLRPDASREELALFEEYRRSRDSLEASRRAAAAGIQDIAEIQVAPRLLRMRPDAQVTLAATVYGADGMPRAVSVRWQSNNINVVEVSADGTARGVAPGTAVVQAFVEAGGRRRAGQATVVVQREPLPLPGRGPATPQPPAPGEAPAPPIPAAPATPPFNTRVWTDSVIKAAVNCAEPAVNAINPGRACYDRRPTPSAPATADVPGPCAVMRQVSPATVNAQVSETGEVLDARPFAPSNCHEFTEAALREVRSLTFAPATQNNQPVRAWVLVRVRPAERP